MPVSPTDKYNQRDELSVYNVKSSLPLSVGLGAFRSPRGLGVEAALILARLQSTCHVRANASAWPGAVVRIRQFHSIDAVVASMSCHCHSPMLGVVFPRNAGVQDEPDHGEGGVITERLAL
jgi:hypothetical protein